MRSWSRSRWVWSVSVSAVILGAVLLVGTGVPPAVAGKNHNPPPPPPPNPFTQILTKLDEILAAIAGIGGGGQEGNHTLRWDQALPAVQRFVILAAFNNEAVLDKNTGLVWEKSPATTTYPWSDARFQCANKNVGGQKGWRLSSFAELSSLVDPSVAYPGPTLPPGHPFLNVQSAVYWSASTIADAPTLAWFVDFSIGSLGGNDRFSSLHAWCVRGGMNADQY